MTACRKSDKASLLLRARSAVLEAYRTYGINNLAYRTSIIDSSETGEALKSGYSIIRSGSLSDVGREVLSRSRICCLCGLRDVSELDHFLPRCQFPEFSNFTLNLVPVCSRCNKLKGDDYVTDTGGQAFIHAYLDSLPVDDQFLVAEIELGDSIVPVFSLTRSRGISGSTYIVLVEQFHRLKLDTHYSEEATELLVEVKGAMGEYFDEGGADAVSKYLMRDARSVAKRHGMNHWKFAALNAAASSVEFCSGAFADLPD